MPILPSNNPLVVITMGDPSGVGPEIILKALKKFRINKKKISLLIVGDTRLLRNEARRLGITIANIDMVDLRNVDPKGFRYGMARLDFGKASFAYLKKACGIIKDEIKKRKVALVTAPINKRSVNMSHPGFSGHTEYLAKVAKAGFVTMFLVSNALKVALVTRHIPFSRVPGSISKEKIVNTTTQTFKALKDLFRIRSPRIGIAGLNPHGGEGGIFGKEESGIIKPAVLYLKKRIPNLTGPIPADTLFHKAYNGALDAVVCMYHDQGLIPFKMISFDKGVNVTLGLPFIRTSPDHGTAFDIAGRNIADPASMTEAVKLAISFMQ